VEYNWYAHRAMEGYFEETGRAGSGYTGFDYQHEVEANGAKTKKSKTTSDAERDMIPIDPGRSLPVAITPILHSPGARTPCELGPTSFVRDPFSASRTRTISRTGILSVTATTSGSSASIASSIAPAA